MTPRLRIQRRHRARILRWRVVDKGHPQTPVLAMCWTLRGAQRWIERNTWRDPR